MATGPMLFELSTSPRSTWVWAADERTASKLGELIHERDGHTMPAMQAGRTEPRAFDIDIGVVALGCLEGLIENGHLFVWHTSQHEWDRRETLYGIPVALPAR